MVVSEIRRRRGRKRGGGGGGGVRLALITDWFCEIGLLISKVSKIGVKEIGDLFFFLHLKGTG